MILEIGKDNGYVIIDDKTGKILSILVSDAIPGKFDFVNPKSFRSHKNGTHSQLEIS